VIVNNQIKKGLLLSLLVKKLKLVNIWQQARTWLSQALCVPGHRMLLNDEECAPDNYILACNCRIFTDFKKIN